MPRKETKELLNVPFTFWGGLERDIRGRFVPTLVGVHWQPTGAKDGSVYLSKGFVGKHFFDYEAFHDLSIFSFNEKINYFPFALRQRRLVEKLIEKGEKEIFVPGPLTTGEKGKLSFGFYRGHQGTMVIASLSYYTKNIITNINDTYLHEYFEKIYSEELGIKTIDEYRRYTKAHKGLSDVAYEMARLNKYTQIEGEDLKKIDAFIVKPSASKYGRPLPPWQGGFEVFIRRNPLSKFVKTLTQEEEIKFRLNVEALLEETIQRTRHKFLFDVAEKQTLHPLSFRTKKSLSRTRIALHIHGVLRKVRNYYRITIYGTHPSVTAQNYGLMGTVVGNIKYKQWGEGE